MAEAKPGMHRCWARRRCIYPLPACIEEILALPRRKPFDPQRHVLLFATYKIEAVRVVSAAPGVEIKAGFVPDPEFARQAEASLAFESFEVVGKRGTMLEPNAVLWEVA